MMSERNRLFITILYFVSDMGGTKCDEQYAAVHYAAVHYAVGSQTRKGPFCSTRMALAVGTRRVEFKSRFEALHVFKIYMFDSILAEELCRLFLKSFY